LFEKCAKVGNNLSYTFSQTFLLQKVAYTIDQICAKKKRLPTSTLNQPLTSQASNNLRLQAWAKFKPPKISVKK